MLILFDEDHVPVLIIFHTERYFLILVNMEKTWIIQISFQIWFITIKDWTGKILWYSIEKFDIVGGVVSMGWQS